MDASELLTELVDAGACRQGIEDLEEHLDEKRLCLAQASEVWNSLDNTFMSNMRWLLTQTGLVGDLQYFNLPDNAEALKAKWPWEQIEPALRTRAASGREDYRRADAFVCFIQDEVKLPKFDPMDLDHPYCVTDVWDQLDAGDHFRVLVLFERELNIDLQGRIKEELEHLASEIASQVLKLYDADWEQPPDELCTLMGEQEIYLVNAAEIEAMWREEFARRERSEMEEKSMNDDKHEPSVPEEQGMSEYAASVGKYEASVEPTLVDMDAITVRVEKLRVGLVAVSNRLKRTVLDSVRVQLGEPQVRAGFSSTTWLYFDSSNGIRLFNGHHTSSLDAMPWDDVLRVATALPQLFEKVTESVESHIKEVQAPLAAAEAAMQKAVYEHE